jgi:predicted dienelactone hydrolase
LIDFMVGASPAASKIDPDRIGFFGFSLGGYTGVVVIGADPGWAIPLCQRSSAVPVCEQILKKGVPVQPLAHEDKGCRNRRPVQRFLYRRRLCGRQGTGSAMGVGAPSPS